MDNAARRAFKPDGNPLRPTIRLRLGTNAAGRDAVLSYFATGAAGACTGAGCAGASRIELGARLVLAISASAMLVIMNPVARIAVAAEQVRRRPAAHEAAHAAAVPLMPNPPPSLR